MTTSQLHEEVSEISCDTCVEARAHVGTVWRDLPEGRRELAGVRMDRYLGDCDCSTPSEHAVRRRLERM